MKCPQCGNELRRSRTDEQYGLCDSCKKKFDWIEDDDYDYEEENISSPKKASSASNSSYSSNIPKKKKGGCLKVVLIVIGALIIIGILGSLFGGKENKKDPDSNSKSTTNTPNESEKKEEPKIIEEHFEVDLAAGNYTAGVDIPTGTYNITAAGGSGNVSSSNMFSGGLNEVMGNPVTEYSTDSFNGLKLEKDVVLSLSSTVTLHLTSENANVSGVTPRTVGNTATIDLSSGNYTAGTDFPAGTYNIVSTGGNGNVSSDNMYDGGLNEILGNSNDGYSITQYTNAFLEEGTILTISGTSIQLVPAGE